MQLKLSHKILLCIENNVHNQFSIKTGLCFGPVFFSGDDDATKKREKWLKNK